MYDTKKSAMSCYAKDKIPTHQKSNIVYSIRCSGCCNEYVVKSDRCVITRMSEHAARGGQPIFQHLVRWEKFLETLSLYKLPDIDTEANIVDLLAHISTGIYDHWKILDTNKNWVQLWFLELFYIKQLKPKINDGLKASKELLLFR